MNGEAYQEVDLNILNTSHALNNSFLYFQTCDGGAVFDPVTLRCAEYANATCNTGEIFNNIYFFF